MALERRKSERERWQRHVELLEKKIESLEKTQLVDATAYSTTNHQTAQFLDEIAPAELHDQKNTARDDGHEGTPPLRHETAMQLEDFLPALPASSSPRHPVVKSEPSSDGPVVISEREVKKRKRSPPASNRARGISIKTEAANHLSSSPMPPPGQYNFFSQESLDLGEVGQKVSTPRKRKELENANGNAAGSASPESALPPPMKQAHAGLYAKCTPRPLRAAPLTPMDANRQRRAPVGHKSDAKKDRRHLGHGIASLAEDGVHYGESFKNPISDALKHTTPAPKGRLDDLLNTPPSTSNRPSLPHSTVKKARNHGTPQHGLAMPKVRELPFELSSRGSIQTKKTAPPLCAESPSTKKLQGTVTERRSGLLRNKAISELRLGDFKINPCANEGVDFAYTDVVRNKDARACLPGCTDPHCCGAEFRALALSEKPNSPLTAAQRQEEQALLERYLGDYAYKLSMISKAERSELWVKAKTQDLADRYGKHRHRYSRMRSPPGFWNADFPSTQEIEGERAEAAEREKRLIEERHREAMRPGGRFLFRDE